jgi:phosphomannomutase
MLIDCRADKYGVEVVETPVGFKWIGQLMRDRDVIIGGEESGGFSILGFIPEKDGILANLLILEMMAYEQKPLKAIYEDTLAEAGQRLYGDCYNYHFTPAQKDSVMKALTALKAGDKLGNVTIEAVDTRDGVKLHFGRYDWLLIRPSGTEPVVRAYWESTLADQSKAIAKGFEQWLEAQNGASSLVGAAKS